MQYKDSGVDIEAGDETVRRIRKLARSTFTPGVMSDIGSFGGLFRLDPARFRDPVLVSSADGVGTKLKVAFMAGRHDTVGADLVNHCVNDILVQGRSRCSSSTIWRPDDCRPQWPNRSSAAWPAPAAKTAVRSLAARRPRCRVSTPMANTISPASSWGPSIANGFDGERYNQGMCLIGLPSSGLHTNGILSRAASVRQARAHGQQHVLEGLAKPLLTRCCASTAPTSQSSSRCWHEAWSRAWRTLPAEHSRQPVSNPSCRHGSKGQSCQLDHAAAFCVPSARGEAVTTDEMFRAFNMGIGLILVCSPEHLDEVQASLTKLVETSMVIGGITKGNQSVALA